MRKILIILISILFCLSTHAKAEVTFDFSKDNNKQASDILNEYVEQFTKVFCPEAKAVFFDVNEDGSQEIVGYARNGTFYSLQGYRLLILKETNDEKDKNTITIDGRRWMMIPSDVYFEPNLPIEIADEKITFKQGDFYKNRKKSARFNKNNIKLGLRLSDATSKKAKKIAEAIEFTQNSPQNNINLSEFNGSNQRNVCIFYSKQQPLDYSIFKNETIFSVVQY